MIRRKLLITIVVAGMLLIAGCTGGAEPGGPMKEDGGHPADPGSVVVNDTIHYDNGTTQNITYDSETIEKYLFERINEFRAENNVSQAGYSTALASSAAAKSSHMVENDYFAHTTPGGLDKGDFISQTGDCEGNSGENLAKTYGGEPGEPVTNKELAHTIFEQWRTSPEGHRAVMVTETTSSAQVEMGAGVYIQQWNQNTDYVEVHTTLHTCH